MNRLPDARRAWYGRTHDRTWRPGDYDPVIAYRRRWYSRAIDVAAAVLLGTAGGVLLALALSHGVGS